MEYMSISTLFTILGVLVGITNIITQVIKQLVPKTVPTNLLAFITSQVVCVAALFMGSSLFSYPVLWYYVFSAVVMGFFVSYAAMVGFDKLKEIMDGWGLKK